MVVETKKIMGDQGHSRSPLRACGAPVLRCHAEAVYVEFQDAGERRGARGARGVPGHRGHGRLRHEHVSHAGSAGRHERDGDVIRPAPRRQRLITGLAMWVVADQIRKARP